MAAQGGEFYRRISSSSCCVYGLDNQGEVEALGTATLIQIGRARFAVSAKHLFGRLQHGPLAIGGEKLAGIPSDQKLFYTTGPDDRFDLAFLRLTDEQISDLGNCSFIADGDMDVSERPNLSRPLGSKYYALGYPCRLNERRKNQPIKPHSLLIATLPADMVAYSKLAVGPDSHLLLELDLKEVSNRAGRTTAPKLYGMSGCGIWSAPRELGLPSGDERLLAILTEYHGGSHKVIVATRIGALLDGVEKSFPELMRHAETI
jgi:hypothetical protein